MGHNRHILQYIFVTYPGIAHLSYRAKNNALLFIIRVYEHAERNYSCSADHSSPKIHDIVNNDYYTYNAWSQMIYVVRIGITVVCTICYIIRNNIK